MALVAVCYLFQKKLFDFFIIIAVLYEFHWVDLKYYRRKNNGIARGVPRENLLHRVKFVRYHNMNAIQLSKITDIIKIKRIVCSHARCAWE